LTIGKKPWRLFESGRRKGIFNLDAQTIARAVRGEMIFGNPRQPTTGVSSDSGTIQAGDLLAREVGELVEDLERDLTPGDWILIKGSRRIRMERVMEGLKGRRAEKQSQELPEGFEKSRPVGRRKTEPE